MGAVKSGLKSGVAVVAEPLICACLKSLLNIPAEETVGWLKKRFTDHSGALPKAIAAANDRAWQAVGLALAGESLFEKIWGRFRDADLKAVRDQIRAFVSEADAGLESASDGLRIRASDELARLKRDGRLGAADVEFATLDMTRFDSTVKIADDAHRAVALVAASLETDAPNLAKVLLLSSPAGGTPLLASAFAFFLRRQFATNEELSRELTHDGLRWLSLKQQAGFQNIEAALDSHSALLLDTLGGYFAVTDGKLDDIAAKLDQFLERNHVSKNPKSPTHVSVNGDVELQRLKTLRDRLRDLPPELVAAQLQSLLGTAEAAAGQYAEALKSHTAAESAARESADRTAQAEAAFYQFKDHCELNAWDAALAALNRAIALDAKRFRPLPKHYIVESILGSGAFGVVFRARNSIAADAKGNELITASKAFRKESLDRPLLDIFGEAFALKNLTHPNIIRLYDHGFADQDEQRGPFIAMELFDGVTLEQHLAKRGKLNLADFLSIFGQVASGLHAAHTAERPIIHRDLKPANIMVQLVGDVWKVKVIDFGLAVKSSARTASQNVPVSQRSTHDKAVVGTVRYSPPEQRGEKPYPIGPHSDVYSFGMSAAESLFETVKPEDDDWNSIPKELATALKRCVSELYFADRPDQRRFHGFVPVLAAFGGIQPNTAKPQEPRRTKPQEVEEPPELMPEDETRFDAIWDNLGRDQLNPKVVDPIPLILEPDAPKPEPLRIPRAIREAPPILPAQLELDPLPAEPKSVPLLKPIPVVNPVLKPDEPESKHGFKIGQTMTNALGMKFAWVPPGDSWLGGGGGKQGKRKFTIETGFWAGVYPVTQAEWLAVGGGKNPSRRKGDRLPVEQVDADLIDSTFLIELNKKCSGDGYTYRLPSADEWEYVARGGPIDQEQSGFDFYFAKSKTNLTPNPTCDLDSIFANFDGGLPAGRGATGRYLKKTTPVGLYLPNPLGLYDLVGNVWEWTSTVEGPKRVFRGGGWSSRASDCSASYRFSHSPVYSYSGLGFRLLAVPSIPLYTTLALSKTLSKSEPAQLPLELKPVVGPILELDPAEARVIEIAQSAPKIGQTMTNALGMKFAWVPPGDSWLGGGGGEPGECKFTLEKGFWAGVYLVTQAEWLTVVGGKNPSYFKGDRLPVEQISANHIDNSFLVELNKKCQGDRYTYRLPTADEWEYVCRGGPIRQDQSGFDFYFAKSKTDLTPNPTCDLDSGMANFNGNHPAGRGSQGRYLEKTTEVGLYLSNSLGIYDLFGNVYEWTSTVEGSARLCRGGGWRSNAVYCAASDRRLNAPGAKGNNLGFRLIAVTS